MKLNLTRGKPSNRQLDLSKDLLALPGTSDYKAGGIDCRNYGDLQGLPELRALLAPVFGVPPERMILGSNSSLSFMHDAIVFALLKGVCDSPRPWSKDARVAFLCPVPGYDRHFGICEEFGIEMIPVPLGGDGPDMDVVEQLVAEHEYIKGMWVVPKYSNPSGIVYSSATIQRLARMKTASARLPTVLGQRLRRPPSDARKDRNRAHRRRVHACRTPESRVHLRLDIEDHVCGCGRRALCRISGQRRVVSETNRECRPLAATRSISCAT